MEQLFNKISVSAICLCGICIKMMEENTGAKLSYKRMTPVFFVCKEQSSRMKSQLIKKDSAANRQSVRPIKRKDKKVVAFISGIKPRKRKSPAHKGLIVIRYYLALRGAENGVTAMVTPFFCVQG